MEEDFLCAVGKGLGMGKEEVFQLCLRAGNFGEQGMGGRAGIGEMESDRSLENSWMSYWSPLKSEVDVAKCQVY